MKNLRLATWILSACQVALAAGCFLVLADSAPVADWYPAPDEKAIVITGTSEVALAQVPLQRLQAAWMRPVFSGDRAPDPGPGAQDASGLRGVILTGVVKTATTNLAMLRLPSGQRLILRRGSSLASGWLLQSVKSDGATFSLQGQQQRLLLLSPRLPAPSRDAMPTLPENLKP
jgi:hypothetical protein